MYQNIIPNLRDAHINLSYVYFTPTSTFAASFLFLLFYGADPLLWLASIRKYSKSTKKVRQTHVQYMNCDIVQVMTK